MVFLNKNNYSKILMGNFKMLWVYDKKDDPGFARDYFSVILRNIPGDFNAEDVKLNLEEEFCRTNILHLEKPMYIKGKYCSIIVLESLEDCEYLLENLNNINFFE